MADLKFNKEITALLVIDPYNDFISERGKVWVEYYPTQYPYPSIKEHGIPG